MAEVNEIELNVIDGESRLDDRWLMSYMACLTDGDLDYYDSGLDNPAHPLFPVCVEWPVILKLRAENHLKDNLDTGSSVVHASHDLHIHAPLKAGQLVTTSAVITGMVQKSPGVYETLCLETRDENGVLLSTTYQGSMRLGEQLEGPAIIDSSLMPLPDVPALAIPRLYKQHISSGFAHIYTECARIWNPIHTDRRLAHNAGLPDILLHGTATLALAVSRIVENELSGDYSCVNRIAARFSGMVFMPSNLVIRVIGRDSDGITFDVVTLPDVRADVLTEVATADRVISRGYIGYHSSGG